LLTSDLFSQRWAGRCNTSDHQDALRFRVCFGSTELDLLVGGLSFASPLPAFLVFFPAGTANDREEIPIVVTNLSLSCRFRQVLVLSSKYSAHSP
jgi:hypothetical protein